MLALGKGGLAGGGGALGLFGTNVHKVPLFVPEFHVKKVPWTMVPLPSLSKAFFHICMYVICIQYCNIYLSFYILFTYIPNGAVKVSQDRVPTVMESHGKICRHGKSWKCHGK